MGLRYVAFRVKYALEIKLGFLKKKFPTNPEFKEFISLDEWRGNTPKFFFESRESIIETLNLHHPLGRGQNDDLKSKASLRHPLGSGKNEDELRKKVSKLKQGIFTFFSSTEFNLSKDYDWITNPDTGYKYDISKHWSDIADLSKEAGDIKYVWEKARFSWLNTIIRFDLFIGEDQAEFVFKEIEDFIDKNPINQGPNYKCSQEISLRTLNWTFALYYYKNSEYLTDELFRKIIHHIYWQIHHVYNNINFSRIAVRNNHAITETLMLYLSNVLFPFIPETKTWSEKGKKWFEKEIEYQIYDDGTFLQFSHNYHRVVVQLLTWAIRLSELNNLKLSKIVYSRAEKTLEFLLSQQDKTTGWLPNYGMNDGALFFPLNNNHYRDYRPQLQALASVLGYELYGGKFEDCLWFSKIHGTKEHKDLINVISTDARSGDILSIKEQISPFCYASVEMTEIINYPKSGFYGFREEDSLTTIRCGSYKDRPAQADALNLDIWYKGVNILFDPGTYKYNTEEKYLKFYHGTNGHNTITLGEHDQMLKGGRFIWYYWTKTIDNTIIEEHDGFYKFEGKITAFTSLGKEVIHHRKVIQYKKKAKWLITDNILNYDGDAPMIQHWNINDENTLDVHITAIDGIGQKINKEYNKAWFSEKYGIKKDFNQLVFETSTRQIETTIEIIEK